MSAVVASLIPTFLIIATGWLRRATGFVDEPHWAGLERVTYVIFFSGADHRHPVAGRPLLVPVLGVGGALVGADPHHGYARPACGPLLERLSASTARASPRSSRATRWNTFVGLAVAGSLFGQRGVALIAVAIAAMVPLSTSSPSTSSSASPASRGRAPGRSCAPSSPTRSSGPARWGLPSICWRRPCRSRWSPISTSSARGAGRGPADRRRGPRHPAPRPPGPAAFRGDRVEARPHAGCRRYPRRFFGVEGDDFIGHGHRRFRAIGQRGLCAGPANGRQCRPHGRDPDPADPGRPDLDAFPDLDLPRKCVNIDSATKSLDDAYCFIYG